MNTQQALSEIREIGDILARIQHTSCIRPTPIACSAVLAFTAASNAEAAMSPMSMGSGEFVGYWMVFPAAFYAIIGGLF